MKQRLQEYVLSAEIGSAVAIVRSLLFVGLQVRQSAEQTAANSAAIQSSVRESMLQTDVSLLFYAGDNLLMDGVGSNRESFAPSRLR